MNSSRHRMSATSTKIKTVGISEQNYWILKHQGLAGDSMNDALTNILRKAGIIQEPTVDVEKKRESLSDRVSRPSQTATAETTPRGGAD
jgi:hypothetical protein